MVTKTNRATLSIKATPKHQREKRIKDQRENPKANPTNKDIQQLLLDTNDRLSEIYDLLKTH